MDQYTLERLETLAERRFRRRRRAAAALVALAGAASLWFIYFLLLFPTTYPSAWISGEEAFYPDPRLTVLASILSVLAATLYVTYTLATNYFEAEKDGEIEMRLLGRKPKRGAARAQPRRGFIVHAGLYISVNLMILINMLGWHDVPLHTVADRVMLAAGWAVIMATHFFAGRQPGSETEADPEDARNLLWDENTAADDDAAQVQPHQPQVLTNASRR